MDEIGRAGYLQQIVGRPGLRLDGIVQVQSVFGRWTVSKKIEEEGSCK